MKILRFLILLIAVLIFWQGVVWFFAVPVFILPSPLSVFNSLWVHTSLIIKNAVSTIIETLCALVLGSLAGMCAALCLAYFRWARFWFLPMLVVSQALPTFAIAPLLVIWFGYGAASKVLVAMLMIFFPVTSAFYDGLLRTRREWLYLAQVMGAPAWCILWQIRIPAALPGLGSGLRVVATFAPIRAVIGEWVGASKGLGFLILNANARMQIDFMFAVLLVLVAFTLILYFSIDRVLKSIIFWSTDD